MTKDTRTSNGYYRVENTPTGRVRLYCGDTDNDWLELTGVPEQQDIEEEIKEAISS